MESPSKATIALKALTSLGPRRVALYAYYRLAMRSGMLKRRLPTGEYQTIPTNPEQFKINYPDIPLPDRGSLEANMGEGCEALFAEAEEIVEGKVRLFGGEPRPLELSLEAPLKHCLDYRENQLEGRDIKFVWEPGRFGWATTLARAYYLSGEEKYAAAFWKYSESFLQGNPPNLGPHWTSAQEAALRLIAMVFAARIFAGSQQTTPERETLLGQALAAQAERIPPTLAYARWQNNNHLLTEAAGLYTAGLALPAHPSAAQWRALGWHWLNHTLQHQIAPNGTYVQQSTNYQRLMLSTALWTNALAQREGREWPEASRQRLAAATGWLLALVEPANGQVPNLGPNDGAYLLPLSTCPFGDYRPVLQAAGAAFLGGRPFGNGPWDEMAAWLAGGGAKKRIQANRYRSARMVFGNRSWAYLRSVFFPDRPGHADQLHLDLWWRGLNVALDPGTYLYNGDPPWDNALVTAAVHNTLTVDGQDQMTRGGRFLWLDWAQSIVEEESRSENGLLSGLVARHDGYRMLGLIHQREVEYLREDDWRVTDRLLPRRIDLSFSGDVPVGLHWLLPDWPWELEGATLRLESPYGQVSLRIECDLPMEISLARAGELLRGEGPVSPVRGWASPTYGQKVPALSFAVIASLHVPARLISVWGFPS